MEQGIIGSKAEAKEKRKRAQHGAAAAGRRAQAVQLARSQETPSKSKRLEGEAIATEVARAMKQGTALVQASLERLKNAEDSWDKHVKEAAVVIDGYPTEVQVLTYMATMSRNRIRMCLAQRGAVRRKGLQKDLVHNYVAEMANNRWATKYPAFGKLEDAERKRYWAEIFGAYKAMYAAASQPTTTEEEDRLPTKLFKNKQATAVLCSRSSTACVGQRRRAQLGSERGSAQYSCQRRDWNVIYRMYLVYLSRCICWL